MNSPLDIPVGALMILAGIVWAFWVAARAVAARWQQDSNQLDTLISSALADDWNPSKGLTS